MRRILRQALSAKTMDFLRDRAAQVAAAADQRARAAQLWEDLKNNQAIRREIREVLKAMAHGRERCMYCEDNEGIAIEHFWPKSEYPHRAFDWLNYLIVCTLCNSIKGIQFPLAGPDQPLLLNPTEEDPLDHLTLGPGGLLEPLPGSAKGRPTIDVIDLNRGTLVKGRAGAWTALEMLIGRYPEFLLAGDSRRLERIEAAVRDYPFAGVLTALLHIAASPDADLLIEAKCLRAIREYPEIRAWA